MLRSPSAATRLRRTVVLVALTGLLGISLAVTASPASAVTGTYTVNAVGDQADTNAGDGICLSVASTCTLRAALTESRLDAGASQVRFAIPGSGLHTIVIIAPLPLLDDTAGGTTIDGYTQALAQPNTDPLRSNAVLEVEVRATRLGLDGLDLRSSGNTVRGLAFFNLRQSIRLAVATATDNVVAGNFLGTNAAGTYRQPAKSAVGLGVLLRSAASRNRIGGPNLADRNVISGNSGRGVIIGLPDVVQPDTVDNVIENNIIGLTPNGLAHLPNFGQGVDVNGYVKRNIIRNNVVSGNTGGGVEISHGLENVGNMVLNNRIGTDLSGNAGPTYARNAQVNVVVEDGPVGTVISGNVIGNSRVGGVRVNSLFRSIGDIHYPTGTRIQGNRIGISKSGARISNGPYGVLLKTGAIETIVGPSNIIAFNGTGVEMTEEDSSRTIHNRVTGNSIHDNTGLGIDLSPISQANLNDAGDADMGPNGSLNWPKITGTTSTSVSGTVCARCRVEVYVSDSTTTDPTLRSSYGEGRTSLGATTAGSTGTFRVTFASSTTPRTVTATATSSTGNTSEFSLNRLVPRRK